MRAARPPSSRRSCSKCQLAASATISGVRRSKPSNGPGRPFIGAAVTFHFRKKARTEHLDQSLIIVLYLRNVVTLVARFVVRLHQRIAQAQFLGSQDIV